MRDRRFLGIVGCGVVLLGLTAIGLHFLGLGWGDSDKFVVVALMQGAVYLLAIWLIRRHAASVPTMIVVIGVAAVMRIIVVIAPPYLSTDIYRYVWDGRVTGAGINPYRYIPADAHLAALRDTRIFPNINRGNYARTIYPPAAEAIFFAVTRLSESVTAMKAAMVGFEAIAMIALLRLLALSGQPPTHIVIYAWHPLPLWEFAGSGHIDAAVVAALALTLWCRWEAKSGLAGLALAGGALSKFYPMVVFPALWRRWDWRMPAAFVAAVILAYLPFAGVGSRVFGFLPQYVVEEGFTAGGAGFYLWEIAKSVLPLGGVSDLAYLAGAGALLAGLAGYFAFWRSGARSGIADIRGAALLAAAFMLLLSPHYAWYFSWLVVFACLVPSAALLWLTLASFLLYLVPVWPRLVWDRRWFLVESALYVPFLTLAAADLWRIYRRERAEHGEHAQR